MLLHRLFGRAGHQIDQGMFECVAHQIDEDLKYKVPPTEAGHVDPHVAQSFHRQLFQRRMRIVQ